ncbi:hypothetical protein BH11BAC3_BH11BAC3_47770 [soil metagenome]
MPDKKSIASAYLKLQLTMLRRQLSDFGISPLLGFAIIFIGFFAFSFFLFNKTTYAGYLYVFIAVGILSGYSEATRNDFLKFTFSTKDYFTIRVAENLLTALPFLIFLGIKKEIIPATLLISLAACMTLYSTKSSFSITIPTPFYKKPFEFIAGFRNSFIAIFIAYFVTAMAILYHNFNLGILSLLFVFFVCLSFYNEPENVFYVGVHKLTANGFLFYKIKTAIAFSTLLTLPSAVALFIAFPSKIWLIAGCQLLGYCYLLTIILAKYAAYPQKMNLPQGILLALSITMPPLLLGIIPLFYMQSKKRLNQSGTRRHSGKVVQINIIQLPKI